MHQRCWDLANQTAGGYRVMGRGAVF